MASKHDGVVAPLAPSIPGLLLGVGVVAVGVGLGFFVHWCVGSPIVPIGLLMILNQVRGRHRVRITFSKLLVEDERLVWGFLIGPTKSRVMWKDYGSAAVVDGQLVVTDAKGGELKVGKGCSDPELQELKGRVEAAAQRFIDDPDAG